MPGPVPFDYREYRWQSADGLVLFARNWMPGKKPRAVINLVHGFKEHSGRYSRWAEQFVAEGIGVLAMDLRGHGLSGGRRGHADRFEKYLGDLHVLRTRSSELFGDVADVLYGHSLGGNLVTNYLISENDLPRGAVITSPWFTQAKKPSMPALAAARLMRYILPGVQVKSAIDPAGLSRDPEVVEAYRNDPLVHDRITPSLYFSIEERGMKASRNIYKINIPLLVMHGGNDPITSCRQTRAFVMHAGRMTTYREWPGCLHELHNDSEAGEVFRFIMEWIQGRILN